ncbi:MAG TPA: glycosyltransferase [Actinomycetales bacterium]|nr:glycosyltransferase [Actinomycetales bacterium]
MTRREYGVAALGDTTPTEAARLPRTSLIVITQNRVGQLLGNLERLRRCSPGVPVVVVDNGSTDGTSDLVRRNRPDVEVVRLPHNRGAAGRTVGARMATTPYVAFADDDSWWAEGALDAATALLDAHPRLGLLAARLVVEPGGALDPVCRLMHDSPLDEVTGVGPRVLGFMACAAVVRREVYLDVGGFHPRFGVGGEEQLLAIDIERAGWDCAYAGAVVAHHLPGHGAPRPRRQQIIVRNALWTAWLRLSARNGLREVGIQLRDAVGCDASTRAARLAGVGEALLGMPWVARERTRVPAAMEEQLALLRAGHRLPERDEAWN